MQNKSVKIIGGIALLAVSGLLLYQFWGRSPEPVSGEVSLSAEESAVVLPSEEPKVPAVSGTQGTALDLENAPVLPQINEPLLVKSRRYKQGEEQTEDFGMNMGWHGDLEITVEKATLFPSSQEAGISDENLILDEGTLERLSEPRFILVEMKVKNIDAAFRGGVQYLFHANMFELGAKVDSLPENVENRDYMGPIQLTGTGTPCYYSDMPSDPNGHNTFDLPVPAGEEKTFTLGYLADQSLIDEQPLNIRLVGGDVHYLGIELNELK